LIFSPAFAGNCLPSVADLVSATSLNQAGVNNATPPIDNDFKNSLRDRSLIVLENYFDLIFNQYALLS
jgi:hypothetical protein